MRQIGTLANAEDARKIGCYLLTQNITTRLEGTPDGWALWVHDENRVEHARQLLDEFSRNPADPRYAGAEKVAQILRTQAEQAEEQHRKRFIDLRRRWQQSTRGWRPLTLALISASVAVAVLTSLGTQHEPVRKWLHISSIEIDGESGRYRLRLADIRDGQVWRLITPIFIHYGPIHLLFNMIMLYQLGSLIEIRRGTWRLGLLVLVSAVVSNLGQYSWSGPGFGGMSGVVYALFGYAWMKSRYDVTSGIYIHPNTVISLLGWFFFCMTGWVGPIANVAHAGGLGTGLVIGYAPHLWRVLRR